MQQLHRKHSEFDAKTKRVFLNCERADLQNEDWIEHHRKKKSITNCQKCQTVTNFTVK